MLPSLTDFEDLEDQVVNYLASVADLKVFGCSIDFLQTATQTYLEDPIWDKPQQGMAYTIVFKTCSVVLPSQEQLEGCPVHHVPLAVHVPMNPEEIVPEGAFAGVPRLRTSVWSQTSGSLEHRLGKIADSSALSNCRPVASIADNAFRDCKLLNSVLAPGCRDFGYKVFAECCSLQWMCASEGVHQCGRNSGLCTALASEKFFFQLLSIQSELKPLMNCAGPVELAIPPSLR